MPRIPRGYSVGHAYHLLNRGNGGAGARLRRVRDREQMYVVERVKRGGPTKGACGELSQECLGGTSTYPCGRIATRRTGASR